jgi:hypothetical protein
VLVFTPKYLDHVVAYYRDGDTLKMRPLADGMPEVGKGHRVFLLASFLDKPGYKASTDDAVRRLERRYRLVHQDKRPQIRTWEFAR